MQNFISIETDLDRRNSYEHQNKIKQWIKDNSNYHMISMSSVYVPSPHMKQNGDKGDLITYIIYDETSELDILRS